jgi:hypothetical protein
MEEIFTKDISYLWLTMKMKCWKSCEQDCPETISDRRAGDFMMIMMMKQKSTKDKIQRVNIITENNADDIGKTNYIQRSTS